MSIQTDYKGLADRLTQIYAKQVLTNASKVSQKRLAVSEAKDQRFFQSVLGLTQLTKEYTFASDLDKALDSIDLAAIYAGVDKREADQKENTDQGVPEYGYEDFIVLELLKYFKGDFFKWVNKPNCPQCGDNGENMAQNGVSGPPSPNPHRITVIEKYKCKTCNVDVEFARVNDATKLLETREGRCGEWVNCFMLILQAVLGQEAAIRYVWNHEDHVWCEYYSTHMKRWIHLDPCEAAFDEPTIYCENWGKKMSFCIGITEGYMVDLSTKYITKADKQIPRGTIISSEKAFARFMERVNARQLLRYYQTYIDPLAISESEKLRKLYDMLVIKNAEREALNKGTAEATKTKTSIMGRQSGSALWTKSRGES